VYRRKTGGGKIPLRFSKYGDKNIEEAYSRHFVKLGKSSDNELKTGKGSRAKGKNLDNAR
jgi:hypothetical protein